MTKIFTKMFRHNLLFAIFIFISISTSFAQLSFDGKVRPDSIFDRVLRQGEMESLLREVPNRWDLQLERLAAYFFHQRINQYRLENGRTTLYWDDRMWLAARNHNLYLLKTKFEHEEIMGAAGFTGVDPSDRIQFVTYNGFKLSLYGENILMNFSAFYQRSLVDNAKSIADESFEQWRNSPPHNKNMLDPDFFAHGTSFYRGAKGASQIFGTTNFGNASDFEVNEIAITWNDSLAKCFPPSAMTKRKPFVSAKWSVQQAENELFNVVKARMPRHTSAYNSDLAYAAEMGIKSKNEIANEQNEVEFTKLRYLKTAKDPKLKLILSKLHEKAYRFEFSKEQLQSKLALKLIDERISKDLPSRTKIKNWGGRCILTEKDNRFICVIDLIYIPI